MSNQALDLLLRRRSVSANSLGEPGPNEEELKQILTAASRVPDHKKLAPWRFILFQGEARKVFGAVLAEACRLEEKEPSAFRLETEAARFMRAPIVIAVISRVVPTPGGPGMGTNSLRWCGVPKHDPRRDGARFRRAVDYRMVWL